MPPKRRQPRPSPPPEPDPSARDDGPGSDNTPTDDDEPDADASPAVPFYNTTFSAHRVSPLYLGSRGELGGGGELTPSRLHLLAQRLRDRLVGDVVRGVEVGAAAGPLGAGDEGAAAAAGRAGALERVEMRWVSVGEVLGLEGGGEEGDDEAAVRAGWAEKRGLHVEIVYELASCSALLLPLLSLDESEEAGKSGPGGRDRERLWFGVGAQGGAHEGDAMDWERTVDPAHFLRLPLLLLRMPAHAKAVLADFLSTTFDCRVTPMRLGTRSLVHTWEAWIRTAGLRSGRASAKDVVISLGFHVPAADDITTPRPGQDGGRDSAGEPQQPLGIRSIEVIVPAAELERFVAEGKRLPAATRNGQLRNKTAQWGWEDDLAKRRKLAGRLYEEGWEWRARPGAGEDALEQPFTEALGRYLQEHLALNLFHPGVRITKIGCGGFAMSESRLKVFPPARSAAGQGSASSLRDHHGAVLELLAGLTGKAQVQMVSA
ncbi:hypothetical protein VTJ83DRAFT_5228 [Remersonia thermophila]|uniref:Siroheme synthase n=1 Tax=Remersonia thermophila TaxID=72144 RepID=A0ABR4DDQ1_9PEZI